MGTSTDKPYKGKIEEWHIQQRLSSITNTERCVAIGYVFGHPEFPDGSLIRTSYIEKAEGKYIYTMNSKYELGKPNEEV